MVIYVREYRPKLGGKELNILKSAKPHDDIQQLAHAMGKTSLAKKRTRTMMWKVARTTARSVLPETD